MAGRTFCTKSKILRFCYEPYIHMLDNYFTECPFVTDFRSLGLRFHELCNYFFDIDILRHLTPIPRLCKPMNLTNGTL